MHIPELQLIRELVLQHMPPRHRLRRVDLTIGTIEDSEDPQFIVLIELEQDKDSPAAFGWANKVTKIIRQKWPRDAFFVKLKIVMV
jgi:hypothetical protein